jgi:hypothetical protein
MKSLFELENFEIILYSGFFSTSFHGLLFFNVFIHKIFENLAKIKKKKKKLEFRIV